MSLDQYSQTPASNDLANYFQTGMAPSKVKNAGWDIMADLASRLNALTTGGGTANAQSLTQTRPLAALTHGLELVYIPLNANTGDTTFAPDGLTAKKMYAYGSVLIGGEIQPLIPLLLKYDTALNSAAGGWHILNPQRLTGSFTGTLTGMTAGTTGTVNYSISTDRKSVDIWIAAQIAGTSNAATMTMTGMPTFLLPATEKRCPVVVRDNGATAATWGSVMVSTTSPWAFGLTAAQGGFTTSASKGLVADAYWHYTLD